MADNNDQGAGGNAGTDDQKGIEALQKQIENLNKGIASYRDEASTATKTAKEAAEAAKEATEKLNEFQTLFHKKENGADLTEDEEKKLQAFAQKHGLVSKSYLDKQQAEGFQAQVKDHENTAVSEFLKAHPEYDDDEKWKEVMKEFTLYRQPTTLEGYRSLLARIHKDVSKAEKNDAEGRARAAIINKSRLGLGGGGQGTSTDDTEAKIEQYQKRYPHLTREQIVDRLADVSALPTKKK